MEAVFTILAMIISSSMLYAQNAVEETGSSSGFAEHFKQFSWIYITAFIVLIGVFIAAYFFGWDKKLFKANTHDDGPQLFI